MALLALAAAGQVDAERAFAAMAQTQGQWTAFRAYAAPDAIMFTPGPSKAQNWLKDRANPSVAVMWWPGRSWVSCDGTLAINTGPWVRRGGAGTGIFTTVWKRQADGSWKWQLDQGHVTPRPVAAGETPRVDRAACADRSHAGTARPEAAADALFQTDDRMPQTGVAELGVSEAAAFASGASDDGTLRWEARAVAGGGEDAHVFRLWQWDGKAMKLVLLETSGVETK